MYGGLGRMAGQMDLLLDTRQYLGWFWPFLFFIFTCSKFLLQSHYIHFRRKIEKNEENFIMKFAKNQKKQYKNQKVNARKLYFKCGTFNIILYSIYCSNVCIHKDGSTYGQKKGKKVV